MREDFLVEIGTEEIPTSYLGAGTMGLQELLCKLFNESEISYSEVKRYYTPRRIACLFLSVATQQSDKVVEITGPPKEKAFDSDGNLTKAAIGFAKAHRIEASELKVKKKGKKGVIYCQKVEKGKPTIEILKSALPEIIPQIEFPKSMHWEPSGMKFARPIRWIVALFGKTIVNFEISGVKSGKQMQGLRGYPVINIETPDSYEELLQSNSVIANPDKRSVFIEKEALELIKGKRLQFQQIGPLGRPIFRDILDEVTNLVECPRAILCKFDEEYLKLPEEVVIGAMEIHQRYFPVYFKTGLLSPYFIVIANTKDGNINEIRAGNERVLRARLEDAEFYYKGDIKIPLEERIAELKWVIWQEGLGTLYDKTQRLVKLSKYVAKEYMPKDICLDPNILEKSARLCKVDLLTSMIKDGKEFTKLEGLYGSILAKNQNLAPEVAVAIRGHSGSLLPTIQDSPEAVVLAIADRIDTIVGAFILNKIPTGSKDPLGIRRAGNEFITIIIENKLHIPLKELISKALEMYRKVQSSKSKVQNARLEVQVFEFLMQRLRKYLGDEGVRYDIIEAVIGDSSISCKDDIVDLTKRARVLNELSKEKDFLTLVTLAKRVRNILRSSKFKVQSSKFKMELLKEHEERELYDALITGEATFKRWFTNRDYKNALDWLLSLGPLINNLFDKVLIMAEEPDLRQNRLALLTYLDSFFCQLADFSKLVG